MEGVDPATWMVNGYFMYLFLKWLLLSSQDGKWLIMKIVKMQHSLSRKHSMLRVKLSTANAIPALEEISALNCR